MLETRSGARIGTENDWIEPTVNLGAKTCGMSKSERKVVGKGGEALVKMPHCMSKIRTPRKR